MIKEWIDKQKRCSHFLFQILKFDFQTACVCLLYLVRESWDWELSLCCLFTQGISISRAFNLVLYNTIEAKHTNVG